MRVFTVLWIFCSSFCSLIGSIVARRYFGTKSLNLVVIGVITCWFSFGFVQWQLLKPYISNSHIWGLTNVVGGIIYSGLLLAGFYSAFYFVTRNSDISNLLGESQKPTALDVFFVYTFIIATSFLPGFILGWAEKLVLGYSLDSSYLNYLPWVESLSRLFYIPILFTCYFAFGRTNIYLYSTVIFSLALVFNSIKGLLIRTILLG